MSRSDLRWLIGLFGEKARVIDVIAVLMFVAERGEHLRANK